MKGNSITTIDFSSLSCRMQNAPPSIRRDSASTPPVAGGGAQNIGNDNLRRDLEAMRQKHADAEQEKDALQKKLKDTENELQGKKLIERVMDNKIGKANNLLLSKMLEHQEAIAAHHDLSEKLGLPIVKVDGKGVLSANWKDEQEAQEFLGKCSDDPTYPSLPGFRDACEVYISLSF